MLLEINYYAVGVAGNVGHWRQKSCFRWPNDKIEFSFGAREDLATVVVVVLVVVVVGPQFLLKVHNLNGDGKVFFTFNLRPQLEQHKFICLSSRAPNNPARLSGGWRQAGRP